LAGEEEEIAVLTVTDGTITETYTVADLEELEAFEVEDMGVTYVGVPLAILLDDAGIDIESITGVNAIAADGFTAAYTEDIFLSETTIVAYATADGDLAEEDGAFRMVVPGAGGKMNPRDLVQIQAVP
jgi:DMSO/TMAO reductase YedYZ molybdopterin-dependent catalytic subunit